VRSALDFLKSAGGATLKGFPGAPRADDLVNKLLENSAGGIAKPGADEKALQDELVKRAHASEEAQKEFAKSLQRSSTAYFDNLKGQQQQFFSRLVEELSSIHLADLANRAGAKGVEAKEAGDLAGQKKTLTGLGFTTGGQVRAKRRRPGQVRGGDARDSFGQADGRGVE
jgi:polyhydroxyalkanoate synthesis regulator phasin